MNQYIKVKKSRNLFSFQCQYSLKIFCGYVGHYKQMKIVDHFHFDWQQQKLPLLNIKNYSDENACPPQVAYRVLFDVGIRQLTKVMIKIYLIAVTLSHKKGKTKKEKSQIGIN